MIIIKAYLKKTSHKCQTLIPKQTYEKEKSQMKLFTEVSNMFKKESWEEDILRFIDMKHKA